MNTKAIFVVVIVLILKSGSALASSWIAGFGMKRLITEQDLLTADPVYLAGYGLFGNRAANNIHDDVSARSLYVSDGSREIMFISLDVVGFSQVFAKQLRQELTRSIDIKAANIILSATHTHSSIDVQGIWGSITEQQKHKLISRIVESARKALTHQTPVSMKLSRSNNGQGVNRRHGSDGIIQQITSIHIETPDHKPVALLFTFGSHPVVLDKNNLQVTSDWVGFAREKLEEKYKTNVIFINGVLGDVVPLPAHRERNFESARRYGESVANSVINTSAKEMITLTGKLSHCTEPLKIDVENVKLIGLTKGLGQGTIDWQTTVNAQVTTRTSVLTLGSLVLITVPGEPVTQLGRELMKKVRNRPVVVLGLTHDSLGYLIPENDFGLENATEEPFSLSSKFATQTSISIDRLLDQCQINNNDNNKN